MGAVHRYPVDVAQHENVFACEDHPLSILVFDGAKSIEQQCLLAEVAANRHVLLGFDVEGRSLGNETASVVVQHGLLDIFLQRDGVQLIDVQIHCPA